MVILQLPALIPRTPALEDATAQIRFELADIDKTTFEPEATVRPAFLAMLFGEIVFPFLSVGIDREVLTGESLLDKDGDTDGVDAGSGT
jgi:hypothetical protein